MDETARSALISFGYSSWEFQVSGTQHAPELPVNALASSQRTVDLKGTGGEPAAELGRDDNGLRGCLDGTAVAP